jgi:hypothetical protein
MRTRDFIDTRLVTEGVKHNFGRKSLKTDRSFAINVKEQGNRGFCPFLG